MKRFFLVLLSVLLTLLTGCSYLYETDVIQISSQGPLALSRIDTFGSTVAPAPADTSNAPPVSNPAQSSSTEPLADSNTPATNSPDTTTPPMVVEQLILSLNTKKIHCFDSCSYAKKIKPENKKIVSVEDEALLLVEGYTVCSWCAKKRG